MKLYAIVLSTLVAAVAADDACTTVQHLTNQGSPKGKQHCE